VHSISALQLFVNASVKNTSLLVEDLTSNSSLTLHGFNADDFQKYRTSTQYQPVLVANATYRLTWNAAVTPSNIDLSIYNFPQYAIKTSQSRFLAFPLKQMWKFNFSLLATVGTVAMRSQRFNAQRRPPATPSARRISIRQVSLRARKVTFFAN